MPEVPPSEEHSRNTPRPELSSGAAFREQGSPRPERTAETEGKAEKRAAETRHELAKIVESEAHGAPRNASRVDPAKRLADLSQRIWNAYGRARIAKSR